MNTPTTIAVIAGLAAAIFTVAVLAAMGVLWATSLAGRYLADRRREKELAREWRATHPTPRTTDTRARDRHGRWTP